MIRLLGMLLLLLPGLAAAQGAAQVWIVSFKAPALAAYDGSPAVPDARGKALAPTAADPGRRLDLQSDAARAYLQRLDQQQAAFLAALGGKQGSLPQPLFRYRVVANGMALALDAAQVQAARAMPDVAAVEPDFVRRTRTDAGPAWIGAEAFWNSAVPGAGTLGRGAGAIVGVIDTGINASHPSFAASSEDGYAHSNPRSGFLGACVASPARCNAKLIGIFDFTSEGARDGSDINGHGSHVASTAAGNVYTAPASVLSAGQPLRVSGVAPRASVVSYKACINDPSVPVVPGVSPPSICNGSALIAAIERATVDAVDVINYSIGSDDPRDPWSGLRGNSSDDARALLNARAAGVLPVVAAGNNGPGTATINAPGNAPWVLAVAAQTHNRTFGTVLADVQGTGVGQPRAFAGAAQGGALERRRLVHAKDFGNALCGTGASQSTTPNGASNPFPPGTFNGEIVICVRGIYARVEKSFNVRQSGAAGYVLVNTLAEAESTVSDNHGMPAVHLGYAAGQQLQALVEAARVAGGQVSGIIQGTQRVLDDSAGDRIAAFSSRGPVLPYGGWLKPNLSAPGVSILAADFDSNGLASEQGTSMAAPHVAGAAALLAAARPGWSVAQIESALLTTGRIAGMLREDARTPATAHDAGGGRARVDEAIRAGLYFEQSRADFVAADPFAGGGADAPTRMNQPALVNGNCAERCSFTRRVTDMGGGGAWRVEARLAAGAQVVVSPSVFALGAGQTQEMRFDFDLRDRRVAGAWVDGQIALVSSAGAAEQRLPVALFANPGSLPARIEVSADATSGARDFDIGGLVELPQANFRATPLVRAQDVAAVVPGRGSRTTYVEPGFGSIVRTLSIAGVDGGRVSYSILAETGSPTSRDVDLFVGQDADGDGAPDELEQLCAGLNSSVLERCTFDVELEGSNDRRTYWFYAINLASGLQAGDRIELFAAAIPTAGPDAVAGGTSLVASGPGHVAARAGFPLRLAWDLPALLPGETWAGFVNVGAARDRPGQIGRIPVRLKASTSLARSARLLDPRGDSVRLRLLPGTAHERIAIDLPANSTGLSVDLANAAGVDLYVARAGDAGSGPTVLDAPPRAAAAGTALGAAANKHVEIGAAALQAGRWYVTPVNSGATDADFTLSVAATASGVAPALRDNAYFNPARGGHGVVVSRAGDQLAAIWFTYRADGAPTWYLAQATAPGPNEYVWRAPLRRSTWDGSSNQLVVVGEVLVTRTADNAFRWSWKVDGSYGSEPFMEIVAPACVDGGTRDYTGSWYDPTLPGFGFMVFSVPQVETQIAFLYDGNGDPAWLYGQVSPFGTSNIGLLQFSGFCPSCATAAVTTRPAGNLARNYASQRTGNIDFNGTFLAPLSGTWRTNAPIERISLDLSCPR